MRDQADKLRQLIDNLKTRQVEEKASPINAVKSKSAKVITVTSGKGGVGKTNMTINLAIALSEMGLKVVILDADFGLANIDVLFGMIPKFTLVDVIHNRKNILEILSDGPMNIKFISGGSGVEELIKLEKSQLDKFVENIALLDKVADIILIDTGAGLSENVMNFVMAADEVLLVTTPEPTSITDAYALIKMVANRDKEKMIRVIVNKAENQTEANEILKKLTLVSEKFLSLKLHPLGYVYQDDTVVRAVKLQQPFSLSFPKGQATKLVKEISQKLIESGEQEQDIRSKGVKGFINRLVGLMKN